MRYIDKFWLENLANAELDAHVAPKAWDTHDIYYATQEFVEELSFLVKEYVDYLNVLQKSRAQEPSLLLRVFKLTSPRKGFIVVRNGEKLVFTGEHGEIFVRLVQIIGMSEKSSQLFTIRAHFEEPLGVLSWMLMEHKVVVTPELVARNVAGKFLRQGALAFLTPEQDS